MKCGGEPPVGQLLTIINGMGGQLHTLAKGSAGPGDEGLTLGLYVSLLAKPRREEGTSEPKTWGGVWSKVGLFMLLVMMLKASIVEILDGNQPVGHARKRKKRMSE